MEIRVAKNAGFCFGVKRAVDGAFHCLEIYQKVYILGHLIHNEEVTHRLEAQGAVTIEDICQIRQYEDTPRAVIIRSHGVSKEILEALENLENAAIVDLTCPYVKRIHERVASPPKDSEYTVIVGAEEHPEVAGIKGWAKGACYVVGSKEDVKNLPHAKKCMVVAQTTIEESYFFDIIKEIQSQTERVEVFHSICHTTKNRQQEAKKLAEQSDIVYVVGGKNSSNTQKLYQICKGKCPKTYHIDEPNQVFLEKLAQNDIISIVAGASTPDWMIREVKSRMSELEKNQIQDQEVESVAKDENPDQEVEMAVPAEETEAQEAEAQEEVAAVEQTEEADPAKQVEEPAAEAKEDEVKNDGAEESDFLSELEKTFVSIRRGQFVKGTVVQVSDTEACVNIGYKSDGIIKKEDLTFAGDVAPNEMFKEGDEIEAEVITLNDGEGNVRLSRKKIEAQLKWRNLVDSLDMEKTYVCKVNKVVKGGVVSSIEGYEAFIPASQLALRYIPDLNEFLGKELEVEIIDVDKRQKRFVASHKNILEREKEAKEKEIYSSFQKGDKLTGKVKRLTDFGAFIDVGGVDGLLHITDISWTKVKHPSDVLKVGDSIEVLVLNVDPEKKRIGLGLKQLQPKPWDLAPQKYIVGETVECKVVRLASFGAFVELEPTIDGLIHISQIAPRRVEKVEDELRVGDVVTAKILEVNPEKKRISLSIRALMDEPVKEQPKEEDSEKEENFKVVIPPIEENTVSLADFFPKQDKE